MTLSLLQYLISLFEFLLCVEMFPEWEKKRSLYLTLTCLKCHSGRAALIFLLTFDARHIFPALPAILMAADIFTLA